MRTKQFNNFLRQQGFTLIELLVSVSLLGLVIVTATNLFFFTIKGGKKSEVYTRVKQNGDYALNVMRTMIRNAEKIDSCSGSSLEIVNPDSQTTIFNISAGQVASNGAALTSNEFTPSSLSFSCPSPPPDKPDAPVVVSVSFTLSKTGGAEEVATQTFQTTISLRNY